MSKLKVNELDTKTGTTITVTAGKTLTVPATSTLDTSAGTLTMANNTVDTAQIATSAVTATELADNAVDTAAILDLNVTVGKLPATVDLSTKTAVYVPAATVTAHVTAFDPIDIRKDIATLALHTATDRDLASHDNMNDTFKNLHDKFF